MERSWIFGLVIAILFKVLGFGLFSGFCVWNECLCRFVFLRKKSFLVYVNEPYL
jgi:hypothetical protein